MMMALEKSDNIQCKYGLKKAMVKLDKVHGEADIRLLIDGLLQNNVSDMYVYFVTPFLLISSCSSSC